MFLFSFKEKKMFTRKMYNLHFSVEKKKKKEANAFILHLGHDQMQPFSVHALFRLLSQY